MRIALLAPPGVQSLDIVGPAEIFWEAERRLGNPSAYEVRIIGTMAGPITGTGNLHFVPDCTIYDPDEQIDTLLVAGDPSLNEATADTIAWLQRRAPEARRYGSICTGAFLLAKAGLLNGRKVTTHWECADKLQTEYPELLVDADKIFIQDGILYTAAGVKRRNRSRPCLGRRRLWTGSRTDRCALHGRIPEKAWRAITIQYTSGRANVEAHTCPARTGICATKSFITSFGGGNGKASMHEHPQLFPFVPP